MNKLIYFFLLSILTLGILGCGKDDDIDPTAGSVIKSAVTAVVNGNTWSASKGNFIVNGKNVNGGVNVAISTSDTLSITAVQVQNNDTTAMVINVKVNPQRLGSYKIGNGPNTLGFALFLPRLDQQTYKSTLIKYLNNGIVNGSVSITAYDAINRRLSGNFGFSIASPNETTYTVVNGLLDNVSF